LRCSSASESSGRPGYYRAVPGSRGRGPFGGGGAGTARVRSGVDLLFASRKNRWTSRGSNSGDGDCFTMQPNCTRRQWPSGGFCTFSFRQILASATLSPYCSYLFAVGICWAGRGIANPDSRVEQLYGVGCGDEVQWLIGPGRVFQLHPPTTQVIESVAHVGERLPRPRMCRYRHLSRIDAGGMSWPSEMGNRPTPQP